MSLTPRFLIVECLITLLLGAFPLIAADREYTPEMARLQGWIDITQPPFHAKPDGHTDCTEELQRAISTCSTSNGGIIYLPAGTYVVSKRLAWRALDGAWRCWVGLQGQSRTRTCIRLADACALGDDDFTRPEHPRAVIHAAAGWIGNEGEGDGRNDAYHNDIRDLTIDLGRSNPGAVGIDWMATNQGSIDSVTVRTADAASGHAGILMTRRWPGPALIRNTVIEGCRFGFAITHASQSMTLEGLTLRHQREAGILCDLNGLAIRGLISENHVPALRLTSTFPHEWGRFPMVVLVDAHLRGGDATQAAIVNEAGYLHLRDVVSSGYRCAVLDRGHDVAGSKQAEYVSDPSVGLFDNLGTGLHLPVRETPSALDPDFSHWTSVTAHGAIPDDGQDDTQAIQSALDSGATTICLPGGTWHIKDTLVMRGAARWLLCGNAILLPTKDHRFADRSALHPVLRIAHTDVGGEVYIERVESRMHEVGAEGSVFIEHASPRTLVVRASQPCAGLAPYRSMLGCGDLFLEDIATHSHNRSSWRFDFPQHIWARQLNVELNDPEAGSNIRNRGATLWILGLKTEDGHVVIDTSAGGSTEVLGACLYPAGRVPPPGTAAFISTDSRVSLSWFFCGSPGGPYPTWVREVRNGVTRELTTAGLPDGRDRALPLYCGWAK